MRSRSRLWFLIALCLALGFATGRLLWPDPAGRPEAALAVARVPAFELQDLSGVRRGPSQWSGQALIINFWATWCAPCRKEMPLLQALHEERGGRGLAVVGIAIDEEDPVRTFVAETGITYPILLGEGDAMAVAESLHPGFTGLPLTVVAAAGGQILSLHEGELHGRDLARIVDVLDRLADGAVSVSAARQALEAP
jgi:thiol-disulfide isomerase/thioredoxin